MKNVGDVRFFSFVVTCRFLIIFRCNYTFFEIDARLFDSSIFKHSLVFAFIAT